MDEDPDQLAHRLHAELAELYDHIRDGLDAAEAILREHGIIRPPLELPIDIVDALTELIPDP